MATRRNLEKVRDLEQMGIKITSDNKSAASWADVIILCVKPDDVKHVLEEVRAEVKGKLIVSVAAAVSLSFLKSVAPESRFVRAMPNIAVLVQESFTAYSMAEDVTKEDEAVVDRIFGALGKHAKVDEKYMDAVTALSGSVPAYAFTFIESLMYGGLKVGLPRDLALKSSAQALLGAAKLVLETGKHPVELKDMVVTPGGVTIEGISMLENSRIRTGVMNAIEAATQRSKRISKAIEKG
jgi:pyrroline-5-carboxylate reductase